MKKEKIYIDGSTEMNHINQGQLAPPEPEIDPTPGLYYVIPAVIFEDESLEPSELVFYALLSGIGRNDGYCFCSNGYLSKRMKVSIRTITNWLEKLEKRGYVQRENEKNGMYWKRKIFIVLSGRKKNNVYEEKSASPPPSSPLPGGRKPTSNIVSKAIVIKTPPPPPPKVSQEPPPTKEEEEEIARQLKERKKKTWLGPVVDEQSWLKGAAQKERLKAKDKTTFSKQEKENSYRALKHYSQAQKYEKWKGYEVKTFEGHVRFKNENRETNVPYACSDEEWTRMTGWTA